jgi:hypothetical protein
MNYTYSNPYDDASGKEKSAFNEGMLQIGRLDQTWRACRIHSKNEDFSGWFLEIEVAWRELYCDAIKINPKIEKIYDVLKLQLNKCYSIKETGLGKRAVVTNKTKIRDILTKMETWLRRIQMESGKGAKYIDEQEDEFE